MQLIFPNGVTLLDCVLRLIAAAFLGAVIGFERKRRQKEAGMRTHIVVALGSTLMMIVSKYGFFDMLPFPSESFSGDRIAANIITGIGFLGAGMIFFRGTSVKGLTTAAGVWATAGVGLAIGAGMYILGIVTTLLLVLIQVFLHKWKIGADTHVFGEVIIVSDNAEEAISKTEKVLEEEGITILNSRFKRKEDGKVQIIYHVRAGEEVEAWQAAQIAEKLPELVQIEVHGDR